MKRAPSFLIALATFLTLLSTAPPSAHAQEEEARLLFERANQHLARGMRARGATRTRELQSALDAYLGVLRLGARTRNVVFNLALTLQELHRDAEAFNYYAQYLREFELSDEDRAAGQERIEAIRPRVAVAQIESQPSGAEVRVDRRDLPVRGRTPLELALPEGEHTLYFSRDGYRDATATVAVEVGARAEVRATLEGEPVAVQVIAPGGGQLTLDGEPIEAGHAIPVPPGTHVVRLELPNAPPVERRFEVQPGASAMAIELTAGGAATQAQVRVEANVYARVTLDGLPIGRGPQVEFPALPGPHNLRIEADGRQPIHHRFTLAPAQRLTLQAQLGATVDHGGINAARAIMGVTAALSLVGAVVATGFAIDAHSQWDSLVNRQPVDGSRQAELHRLADNLEAATIATDILWGATAAFGLTTLILLIVDPGSDQESTIQVAAQPTLGGGAASVRGTL